MMEISKLKETSAGRRKLNDLINEKLHEAIELTRLRLRPTSMYFRAEIRDLGGKRIAARGQQTVALVRVLEVRGLLKALPRGHACPGRRSACAAVRATNKGKACLDPAPEGFISAPEPRSMASKSLPLPPRAQT